MRCSFAREGGHPSTHLVDNGEEVREGVKKARLGSLSLRRTPDPPLVVPWESEIFLVNICVVVDAKGLETDFTLEKKKQKKSERKTNEENLKHMNFTFRTISS